MPRKIHIKPIFNPQPDSQVIVRALLAMARVMKAEGEVGTRPHHQEPGAQNGGDHD